MNYNRTSDIILHMRAAGYVLAGGASRRMGRDKALLPFRGRSLVEHVVATLETTASPVTIVGFPEKYRPLGLRTIPDLRPGCGPLAGIEAALQDTDAEWNLVFACDVPTVEPALFRALLSHAGADCDSVIPVTPDGRLHPLCAAFHKDAGKAASNALDRGVRRVLEGLEGLRIKHLPVASIANTNTPEEWAAVAD